MNTLLGVIDTHVHSFPDVIERKLNDLELVEQARAAGMMAVMLKSHTGSTCERAYLLNQFFPDFRVFGGIVLNDSVGGFNPHAVEAALAMGASQVWMPTKSAANHCQQLGGSGTLAVSSDGKRVRAELVSILKLIAEADGVLATGHLSPEESHLLIDEALAVGVRRISVTHPEWKITGMPVEMQKQLASSGSTFFERCLVSTQTDLPGHVPFETIAQQIRSVGVATSILATDFGMPQYASPVDGMRQIVASLTEFGFAKNEIDDMVRRNPGRLLFDEIES